MHACDKQCYIRKELELTSTTNVSTPTHMQTCPHENCLGQIKVATCPHTYKCACVAPLNGSEKVNIYIYIQQMWVYVMLLTCILYLCPAAPMESLTYPANQNSQDPHWRQAQRQGDQRCRWRCACQDTQQAQGHSKGQGGKQEVQEVIAVDGSMGLPWASF